MELPAYLYLAAISVALALIDLDVKRLPNVIVMPSYVVAGLLLLLPAVLMPNWPDYLNAWLGAVALFAFYFLLAFIYPGGDGFRRRQTRRGARPVPGVAGVGPVIVGGFLGFLLGAVVGIGILLTRKGRAQDRDSVRAVHAGTGAAGGAVGREALADVYGDRLRLKGLGFDTPPPPPGY